METTRQTLEGRKTFGWRGDLLALGGGAILPLSFAPYNFWLFGLLSTGLLAQLLRDLPAKRAWLRSFAFGLGMFGTGVSWVYVSIHDFGFTAAFPAALMTFVFVAFLALVFSLPFYLYSRCIGSRRTAILLGFPAVWVLGEWLRSWLLTGFPWLYVGYGHIASPLGGWAPVLGVYGVSFIAVFSATATGLLLLYLDKRFRNQNLPTAPGLRYTLIICGAMMTLWLSGGFLKTVNWTHHSEQDKLNVALVQPNIPLQLKWNPLYRPQIIRTLLELSRNDWRADIILWPEAAIPYQFTEAGAFIRELESLANEHGSALISGIIVDDPAERKYYNSIMGIGAARNIYYKQRLVPFGEYVPLEKYLRGIIAFFDLPNSIIHKGSGEQTTLQAHDFSVAPYICYEVVYPDLVASHLGDAQLMLTISNDAWFGNSIGPLQHFQMAQMRALEHGRYMIRGTNTGLSGIIDHKGRVTLTGNQFESETIRGHVFRTHGKTPFSQTGSWPILIFCALLAVLVCRVRSQSPDRTAC